MKFKDSFRPGNRFWLVLGMEYAFLAVSLLFVWLYGLSMNTLSDLFPNELDLLAPQHILEANTASMEFAVGRLIIYTVILLIVLLLNFSFWKGWIWAKMLKKRYNWKLYLKFTLVNLPWLIIWIFVMMVVLLVLGSLVGSALDFLVPTIGVTLSYIAMIPVYIFVFMPIVAFLITSGNVLYINFFTKKRFIKETWEIIKDIKKYCVMYIWMGVLLLVLSIIYPFVGFASVTGILISFILIALYSAWLKFYIVKSV